MWFPSEFAFHHGCESVLTPTLGVDLVLISLQRWEINVPEEVWWEEVLDSDVDENRMVKAPGAGAELSVCGSWLD